MTARNGKIANLPNDIREQLNLRLLEGENGRELAAWLNALPAVQSILGSQFNASPISEVNLTHWRQGGYLQWLTERECFDSARALADGDCDLATTGLSAERLLNVLTLRLGQLLMRWDTSPDESVSHEPIAVGAEPLGEGAGGVSRQGASCSSDVSRKEASLFSLMAKKARILQGISRSLLAIHRIQSQRSNPSHSLPKDEPLATASIAVIAPASKPAVPPHHPVAVENCAESHTNGASGASQKPARPSPPHPVASSNPVPGLATAISTRLRALRGRPGARPEIPAGSIAPSIIASDFSRSPFKPDLDPTEILHAV